jgi:hypothetical protein
MIQRIQTLYLSLTAILSFLFLNGSFFKFIDHSGSLIKVTFTQVIRDTSALEQEVLEKTFLLSPFIILIVVLSVMTILLFKKRSLQLLLGKLLIILIIAFIFVSCSYVYILLTKYNSVIVPGFKMVIPLLQLILSVLAYRGIRKDDNLVKSYDRLR